MTEVEGATWTVVLPGRSIHLRDQERLVVEREGKQWHVWISTSGVSNRKLDVYVPIDFMPRVELVLDAFFEDGHPGDIK